MTRDTGRHESVVAAIRDALARERPRPGPPFPCPYLPGREARYLTIGLPAPAPGVYHALMDLNFRRSGETYYRPECEGCGECRMLRVPIATFRPSRAQRRCLARNGDLAISAGAPELTDEKADLYARYLAARHDDGGMDGSREELAGFLYSSRLHTLELSYREPAGRLVAIGIVDVEPRALSAVYCYFDPDAADRSLGVFNVLTLVDLGRRRGAAWLYLGYHVAGSAKMGYKAGYRPAELLVDGVWSAPNAPART